MSQRFFSNQKQTGLSKPLSLNDEVEVHNETSMSQMLSFSGYLSYERASSDDDDDDSENYWSSETNESFIKKAQCFVKQYENFTEPTTQLKLNGSNTQRESIADNGGIKLAYLAYQKYVKVHGEEKKLPGLNYSPNQLFWISNAQSLCTKLRTEAMRDKILNMKTSPNRFRVLGPFSNSKEFSKDFQCKLNSKMNPAKKCEIW
jgi:neprilysin